MLDAPPAAVREESPEERLRAYVPRELWRRLREASGPPLGERRTVTVLFADTVGSTALGRALDPETYYHLMNRVVGMMIEAVSRYEGTVARLQGDGILALFGAPIAHEDDPRRAVQAGLELLGRTRRLAEEVHRAYGVELSVRLGVHTGPVIVGEMGSPVRLEYTAIGDTANLASRLEASAPPGGLLVSPSTWSHVSDAFLGEPQELVLEGAPFLTYHVRAGAAGERRLGRAGPLIGRRRELRLLGAALDRLRGGRGGVVFLLGPPGIGKSRLAQELRRQAGDLAWLQGRCLAFGGTPTYQPVIDLLQQWCGVTPADPPWAARSALGTHLRGLMGPEGLEILPYLSGVLGEPAGIEVDLSSESLRTRTREALLQWLIGLGRKRCTVTVLEDLQWADAASLELLEALLEPLQRTPLLLLLVLRAERDSAAWHLLEQARSRLAPITTEIELRPLEQRASRSLLRRISPGRERALEDRLLRRAQGNPLYLEELAHAARAGREIPETLEGLILSRLDRLPEPLRRLVQLASVVGQVFSLPLLAEVASRAEGLRPELEELERLDLIVRTQWLPYPEYRFKHALVQEVVYHSLLRSARRQLHLSVAQALEGGQTAARADLAGLLGHHLALAGERTRAAHYLSLGGDQARAALAHGEALNLYRRLLEIYEAEGDAEALFRTHLKSGLVHHRDGNYAAARESYGRAFAHRPRVKPPRVRFEAQFRCAGFFQTLDPASVREAGSLWMVEQLFEPLVALDGEDNLVPAAARSWTVSEHGRVYRFRLDPSRRWSDGRPVTAQDFVLGWRRCLEAPPPGGLYAALVGASNLDQARLSVVDEAALDIRLPAAMPTFLDLLAMLYPAPAHQLSPGEEWRPSLSCNGAFVPERLTPELLVLAANPHFPGPRRGNLRRALVHTLRDEEDLARLADAYVRGALEATLLGPHRAPGAVAESETFGAPGLSTLFLCFNTGRPPFDAREPRLAIAHALQRRSAADLRPARGGLLPPAMAGHTPDLAPPFDPRRARQLGAGLFTPRPLRLACAPLDQPLARALAGDLKDHLGLELEIASRDPTGFGDELERGTADLWLNAWQADYPDPDSFLRSGVASQLGRGPARWPDHGYWELVERARTAPGLRERIRLYRRADSLLVREEVRLVPLAYGVHNYLVKPHVEGFHFSAYRRPQLKDVVVRG